MNSTTDNAIMLAEAEIRRLELAASLPKLNPAKSASECLTLPIPRPRIRPLEEQERERIEIERRKLLEASGAPKRHLDGTGIHDRNHAWRDALDDLIPKLGCGFLVALIGLRGSGKTQLATEIIRANCSALRTSKYVKAIEVFVRIKEAYNARAIETEREAIEAFQKPSLLILDEMSERGESQWEERMLRLIIDKRYDEKKDTLLLGNFTASELAKSVGDSVASRLQETGGIIQCDWPSFRL